MHIPAAAARSGLRLLLRGSWGITIDRALMRFVRDQDWTDVFADANAIEYETCPISTVKASMLDIADFPHSSCVENLCFAPQIIYQSQRATGLLVRQCVERRAID
jgi:hypothetical protein